MYNSIASGIIASTKRARQPTFRGVERNCVYNVSKALLKLTDGCVLDGLPYVEQIMHDLCRLRGRATDVGGDRFQGCERWLRPVSRCCRRATRALFLPAEPKPTCRCCCVPAVVLHRDADNSVKSDVIATRRSRNALRANIIVFVFFNTPVVPYLHRNVSVQSQISWRQTAPLGPTTTRVIANDSPPIGRTESAVVKTKLRVSALYNIIVCDMFTFRPSSSLGFFNNLSNS